MRLPFCVSLLLAVCKCAVVHADAQLTGLGTTIAPITSPSATCTVNNNAFYLSEHTQWDSDGYTGPGDVGGTGSPRSTSLTAANSQAPSGDSDAGGSTSTITFSSSAIVTTSTASSSSPSDTLNPPSHVFIFTIIHFIMSDGDFEDPARHLSPSPSALKRSPAPSSNGSSKHVTADRRSGARTSVTTST